jgi:hypothetical protein
MLEFLREQASDRKLRLFAVACCQSVWELMPDDMARRAVELAEMVADDQADTEERSRVLSVVDPRANTDYGVFSHGGFEGTGSVFAAMAAAAALNPMLIFTFHMGHVAAETFTPWECVAMARGQTAKVDAQEKCWQERERDPRYDDEDEPSDEWYEMASEEKYAAWDKGCVAGRADHCSLLREIFGNPFHPVTLDPAWRTPAVMQLARSLYEERRFEDVPVLADALEEAGCTNAEILDHCRSGGDHVRGCWLLDLLLGKE